MESYNIDKRFFKMWSYWSKEFEREMVTMLFVVRIKTAELRIEKNERYLRK